MDEENDMATQSEQGDEEPLPESVPVPIPDLPATLSVSTPQQLKALGDATRSHILNIIKYEPATAKQLGERLHIPPGTIGHHLQVLEAAGLAQVVARRLVRGIVAKYYMRTARLFLLDFPSKATPESEDALRLLAEARDQLTDSLVASGKDMFYKTGFPHARLSREHAEEFAQRLFDLVYEFATQPPDPDGQIYSLYNAFFLAPPYLQDAPASPLSSEDE